MARTLLDISFAGGQSSEFQIPGAVLFVFMAVASFSVISMILFAIGDAVRVLNQVAVLVVFVLASVKVVVLFSVCLCLAMHVSVMDVVIAVVTAVVRLVIAVVNSVLLFVVLAVRSDSSQKTLSDMAAVEMFFLINMVLGCCH